MSKRIEEIKAQIQDHEYFSKMKMTIRREMKNLFKIPDNAFAEMDFNGNGYIAEEDFFRTMLNYKLPYTKDEVKKLFKEEKIFSRIPDGKMDFELFKKTFFPQRTTAAADGMETHEEVNLITTSEDPQSIAKTNPQEMIVDRMMKIEDLLKEKFSSNWTSVRKAFLDIDLDFDGFITAEDIAKRFGKDNQGLDFRDLRTLIKNRDSKREGKIDFKDFCRWMGVAIEPSETFYFRHDSYRNPGYENNLVKETKNYGEFRKIVSDRIMNSNLMKRILDKISSQWKTLKKAFSDLNQEKNGWISEVDLKKYLTNWGFDITEEQFREFYEFLDYDRDGHITYDDFKKSVGSVISPVEFLYFRQDLPKERSTCCKHSNCWEETKGMGKYCFLHKKIIKDKTLTLLSKIQTEISLEKWKEFIVKLKASFNKQAPNQISLKKFFKILSQYNVTLSKAEKEDIVECFHLKDEGNQTDINIQAVINFEKTKEVNKVYKKIDLDKREDEKELDVIKENLSMISEQELIKVLSRMPNMVDLWKSVKKNDVDTNGFLTINELNTIFAQIYPELEGKSLFQILRPFCSIQNRSLINYKKLKEFLETKMAVYLFEKENAEENLQTRNQNIKGSMTYDLDNKLLSPREIKSPSLRRMEQIKDEILKAAVSSPLILANRKLAEKYIIIQ